MKHADNIDFIGIDWKTVTFHKVNQIDDKMKSTKKEQIKNSEAKKSNLTKTNTS